jgi:hypothetical protein
MAHSKRKANLKNMATIRNYLLDPNAFSPNIANVLDYVPLNRDDLQRKIHENGISLPSMLAQLLVVAKNLYNPEAKLIAKALKIRIPSWCHEQLTSKLMEKDNLFPFIAHLLKDLYNTRDLKDISPQTSLLYRPEFDEFTTEYKYFDDAVVEGKERFFNNMKKDSWAKDIAKNWILTKTFPPRMEKEAQSDENAIIKWLEQKSFYDLRMWLCAISESEFLEWPSKTNVMKAIKKQRRQFRPSVPPLKEALTLLYKPPKDKTIEQLASIRPSEVRIGKMPKDRSEAKSQTYYVGETEIENDPYIPQNPDWQMIVDKVKNNKADLVLEGQNGILERPNSESLPIQDWKKLQYALLEMLFLLDVSSVKWRDRGGTLHERSPAMQLLSLVPERADALDVLHLSANAKADDIKHAKRILLAFYDQNFNEKVSNPHKWKIPVSHEEAAVLKNNITLAYDRLMNFVL